MNRTPHPLARSPHLRMLAWLAWMFLAVVPVQGVPGAGMTGAASAGGPMVSVTHAMDHAMQGMADDCCMNQLHGDHCTMQACHCVTTGDLPTLLQVALVSAATDALHVPRQGADAPLVTSSPPLRPPALPMPA
ncbi:hypothetical protein ACPPVV_06525 [Rhodanobacter sp. Col0626]|uniref:hypothetical protein n=1 Tax=Rhodanobacter sp. Col0626 TaxID=3415679 RepID=UPI003CF5C806